jgi:type IV pilus assembly protein PilB
VIDFKKVKIVPSKDEKATQQNPQAVQRQQAAAQDQSVAAKLDEIVAQALAGGASEIHVDPVHDRTRVRMRVRNQLVDSAPVEPGMHSTLVNRIKVLGAMDITKRGVAQKGYFKVDLEGKQVELVALVMPTSSGEKAFIKIHYRHAFELGLDQLGLYPKVLETYKKLLERPNGLVIAAGPPGSGRTSSCYACLQHLARPEKNVTTFESNIRYELLGATQGKPEERYDFTYQAGLRACIDQEPDVLYVGEMNDAEVARMTLAAAFGKRIVIGRMNASDGATAMLTLLDMGLPGFLVTSGVIGVLSQRLVRRLCDKCRQAYQPNEVLLGELGIRPREGLSFFRAGGCDACDNTGFVGQLGLFELFTPTDKVRERILARATAREINEAAGESGFIPLKHDGIRKASQGLTTLEDVLSRL